MFAHPLSSFFIASYFSYNIFKEIFRFLEDDIVTKRETKWIVKPETVIVQIRTEPTCQSVKYLAQSRYYFIEAFCVGHKKLAKKKTPHTFELEQEMINARYCDLKKNKVVKFAKNSLGSLKFASTFLT